MQADGAGGLWLLVAADFVRTGGMDRANYGLAEYLADDGAEVHLVGHGIADSLRRHPRVHWHAVARPLGRDALGWELLARAGKRWARRLSREGGRVVVNGGNCAWADINWVHYLHAAYNPPARAGAQGWWTRAKHVRACRDEERALSVARLVIANSDATRQDILRRYPCQPESVGTVYYGCDAEQFGAVTGGERLAARQELGWNAEGRTALFIGELGDRRKGFDTVFAAWQQLSRQSDWDLELGVVGRGRELESWKRQAEDAGWGARVRFLGFRRDVPKLLAAADVMLAPARYEAYGLAVQEALARGIPALLSARSGVAERVPGELAGLLLRDPESAGELAERLLWWRARGQELRPGLERLGTVLRSWTWEKMAQQILQLADNQPRREAARP